MNDKAHEINLKIRALNQEKDALLAAETKEKEDYIKSLVWTKDCSARLVVDGLMAGCAGCPTYRVHVFGNNPRSSGTTIVESNKSSIFNSDIVYGHLWSDKELHMFYTDCKDVLIKFLRTTKFKSLEYDKDYLAVLRAAEEVSNENFGND